MYAAIKREFGEGVDKFDNDLFEIATRAKVLPSDINADSASFNEILAGELGVDLEDVENMINVLVDNEEHWETFKEYKELRRSLKVSFEKFVEFFNIVSE